MSSPPSDPAASPASASVFAVQQSTARAQLVLFDLDGTLADTAPDLIDAINGCLVRRGMPARPIGELRPWASRGARGLIGRAFGLGPQDPGYEELRVEFIERYEAQLCRHTSLFPGVTETLARIEAAGLRWGIVTNKVSRLTTPLVHALGLDEHAACVVSGDTAAHPKPDPAPIRHALELCRCSAADGIYVGDDRRDIEAGRSAGVRTFAVAYGYSSGMDDIREWRADHIIHRPGELLDWLLPGQA
jgi:phosphoglycolate phosphatase